VFLYKSKQLKKYVPFKEKSLIFCLYRNYPW